MPYTLPNPIACAMPDDDNSAEWAKQREKALLRLLAQNDPLTEFLSVEGEEKLKSIPREQRVDNAKPAIRMVKVDYTKAESGYKGQVHILGSKYRTTKSWGMSNDDLMQADRTEPEENLVVAQGKLLETYDVIHSCYRNWQKKIDEETNEIQKKEYCLLARRQIAELIFSVALYEAMNTRFNDITVSGYGFDERDKSYEKHFGKLLYMILKQHFGTEYLPDVVSIVEHMTGDYQTVKWEGKNPTEFQVQCRTLLCHTKPSEYLSQAGREKGMGHWQDYFQELNNKENRNNSEMVKSKVVEIADYTIFSDAEVAIALTTPIQYEGNYPSKLISEKAKTEPQSGDKYVDGGSERASSPTTVKDKEKIEKIVEVEIANITPSSTSLELAKANHELQINRMAEIIKSVKKTIGYNNKK